LVPGATATEPAFLVVSGHSTPSNGSSILSCDMSRFSVQEIAIFPILISIHPLLVDTTPVRMSQAMEYPQLGRKPTARLPVVRCRPAVLHSRNRLSNCHALFEIGKIDHGGRAGAWKVASIRQNRPNRSTW
jgi:hypothetical protein